MNYARPLRTGESLVQFTSSLATMRNFRKEGFPEIQFYFLALSFNNRSIDEQNAAH